MLDCVITKEQKLQRSVIIAKESAVNGMHCLLDIRGSIQLLYAAKYFATQHNQNCKLCKAQKTFPINLITETLLRNRKKYHMCILIILKFWNYFIELTGREIN